MNLDLGHASSSNTDSNPAPPRSETPRPAREPEYTVPPYIYTAPVSVLVAERQLVDRLLFTICTELKPGWRDAQAACLRCLRVLDDELTARDGC